MNSEQRQAYIDKLKARLERWNAELDTLDKRAAELKADARQQFAELRQKSRAQRDQARQKLQSLQREGEGNWEKLKLEAEEEWRALEDTLRYAKERLGR